MAAPILLLPTEATTEEKQRTLVQTDAVPHTIGNQNLFKEVWTDTSRHIIISTVGEAKTKISNGKGSLSH